MLYIRLWKFKFKLNLDIAFEKLIVKQLLLIWKALLIYFQNLW